MKIIVTGGAGFIGSALVRNFVDNYDYELLIIDKLTYAGNKDNIKDYLDNPKIKFAKLDICDDSEIKDVFNSFKPDAIIHLAAESHVDRSITSSKDFIQTNLFGTFNLLDAARSYWENLSLENKKKFRFLHVSTDEVYGDLPHPDDNSTNNNIKFTETTPYSPSSPYSATKAGSDHLVKAWMRTYGMPILITNCSNNYGPYQFPEKLVPLTILNAIKLKKLTVYGNGRQIRDWLYVDDHTNALHVVLKNGVPGETYNIGGKSERMNIDVIKEICLILDELIPLTAKENILARTDLITYVGDRPGHDRRYAIDISKISKELNWHPSISFRDGLKKTVEWYINNDDWINRVLNGEYRNEN